MLPFVLSLLVASNASGKPLVRAQPGTMVASPGYRGPLIADDPGTVAHLTWNGIGLMDSRGVAWTTNGTVPQVQRSGKVPPGAGPTTVANNYSTTAAGLFAAGPFSVCVVFATGSAANQGIVGATSANDGYAIDIAATGNGRFGTLAGGSGTFINNAGTISTSALNVVCGGRSGTTNYAKVNLGAIGSATGTYTAHTAVQVGYSASVSQGFSGTIYEVWFSTTTPSDALFTAIMQRVKLRAQITAW